MRRHANGAFNKGTPRQRTRTVLLLVCCVQIQIAPEYWREMPHDVYCLIGREDLGLSYMLHDPRSWFPSRDTHTHTCSTFTRTRRCTVNIDNVFYWYLLIYLHVYIYIWLIICIMCCVVFKTDLIHLHSMKTYITVLSSWGELLYASWTGLKHAETIWNLCLVLVLLVTVY